MRYKLRPARCLPACTYHLQSLLMLSEADDWFSGSLGSRYPDQVNCSPSTAEQHVRAHNHPWSTHPRPPRHGEAHLQATSVKNSLTTRRPKCPDLIIGKWRGKRLESRSLPSLRLTFNLSTSRTISVGSRVLHVSPIASPTQVPMMAIVAADFSAGALLSITSVGVLIVRSLSMWYRWNIFRGHREIIARKTTVSACTAGSRWFDGSAFLMMLLKAMTVPSGRATIRVSIRRIRSVRHGHSLMRAVREEERSGFMVLHSQRSQRCAVFAPWIARLHIS